MIERRIHPRVSALHPALYLRDTSSRPAVAKTVDLSFGGIRIETPHSLITGESLQISFAIRPQVIQCMGRVVHILELPDENAETEARYEAGIQFEGMSTQDKDSLKEYLSSVMEQ
jgi:hypothetical protein